jgi:uncharacterized protein (TIGR03086 family)
MDVAAALAVDGAEELTVLRPAIRYLLHSLLLVRDANPTDSTPCQGWNLADLLRHLHASLGHLTDLVTMPGTPSSRAGAPSDPGTDVVTGIRGRVIELVVAWIALPTPGWKCVLGDRVVPAKTVRYVAATELVLHGWDISQTCGARQPIPDDVAAALLPAAPWLAEAGAACGVFAEPVPAPAKAGPGRRLLARYGRREIE